MRAPWESLLPRPVFDPMTIIGGASAALSAVGTIGGLAGGVAGSAASAASQRAAAKAQYDAGVATSNADKIQAASATYEGETENTIDQYKAGLSAFNATVDLQKGIRLQDEAAASADIQARSTGRALGRAQAAYGASGVTMEGSPLMVMHDIATEGNLQKQLILYGGSVAAGDQKVQWALDDSQASIYRALGNNAIATGTMKSDALLMASASALAAGGAAQKAGDLSADATLLTGLGKAASAATGLLPSSSTVSGWFSDGSFPSQVGGGQVGAQPVASA